MKALAASAAACFVVVLVVVAILAVVVILRFDLLDSFFLCLLFVLVMFFDVFCKNIDTSYC